MCTMRIRRMVHQKAYIQKTKLHFRKEDHDTETNTQLVNWVTGMIRKTYNNVRTAQSVKIRRVHTRHDNIAKKAN